MLTINGLHKFYLDLALQGKKGSSAKDLRRLAFLNQLFGEEECKRPKTEF